MWRLNYDAVLSESDHRRLFSLVEAAEAAILTRLADLGRSQVHHSEWKALEEALANLAVVKRDKLRYGAISST
jgi:hypothetical protein